MTLIAVLTIPVAVLGAIAGPLLHRPDDQRHDLGRDSHWPLAPWSTVPLSVLENTHRHLGLGAKVREAPFCGASEVAMPELVAMRCTLLVLAPLAFMPGMGAFLFRPMFLAVTFRHDHRLHLSRSFVPSRCAHWMKPHGSNRPRNLETYDYEHRNPHENPPPQE